MAKPSFTSLVAFVLIAGPCLYVLSYGPAVRLCGYEVPMGMVPHTDGPFVPRAEKTGMAFYTPVEWLRDETAMSAALSWWVDLWANESGEHAHPGSLPQY